MPPTPKSPPPRSPHHCMCLNPPTDPLLPGEGRHIGSRMGVTGGLPGHYDNMKSPLSMQKMEAKALLLVGLVKKRPGCASGQRHFRSLKCVCVGGAQIL